MNDRSDKRRANGSGLRGMSRQGAALRARALRDAVLANGWDADIVSAILSDAGQGQPRLY